MIDILKNAALPKKIEDEYFFYRKSPPIFPNWDSCYASDGLVFEVVKISGARKPSRIYETWTQIFAQKVTLFWGFLSNCKGLNTVEGLAEGKANSLARTYFLMPNFRHYTLWPSKRERAWGDIWMVKHLSFRLYGVACSPSARKYCMSRPTEPPVLPQHPNQGVLCD